ncbi:MAG TPA: PAC2 family protein [Acidimicrobiales bacterium]|nr:PAC2 family protein [Acidimicrobiales bacterium]
MEHVVWSRRPALTEPTMIAAFAGWNDAGDAATMAVRHLIEQWGAEPFASIDPEEYYDFQATRPQVYLDGGQARRISWPANEAYSASTPGGDVVLVLGVEPQLRWRGFTHQIAGIAEEAGTRLVVTLGALLADVVHRRPVSLIGTATDQALIDCFDLQRSQYEGPTGIVGVLHDTCRQLGMGSLSLWAAVPAYASQVPSPKAAMALGEGACRVIGSPWPGQALERAVDEYEAQIDGYLEQDDELAGYVQRLELMGDGEDETEEATGDGGEPVLDPGADTDQMLEDIERFLRDQGS